MFANNLPTEEKSAPEFKGQLTRTQKELLESFFGREGFYLQTIKENEDINLGIKLLYLERAITESPKNFLNSLEKLCLAPEKASIIELVRALKVINDLYYNNHVKYGVYGSKKALDHFFHGLGNVNLSALQLFIKGAINTEISALISATQDNIADQKKKRISDEENIFCNDNLPVVLDLPLQHKAPCLGLSFDANEWMQKKDSVRTWALNLQQARLIDRLFTDVYLSHPRIAYAAMRTLYELSWSEIPFSKENIEIILEACDVASSSNSFLSDAINCLAFFNLDTQKNFDTITDGEVYFHIPEILSVLNTVHRRNVQINQPAFDKIITGVTNGHDLERIYSSINSNCKEEKMSSVASPNPASSGTGLNARNTG